MEGLWPERRKRKVNIEVKGFGRNGIYERSSVNAALVRFVREPKSLKRSLLASVVFGR